jgi:hypothetical protein
LTLGQQRMMLPSSSPSVSTYLSAGVLATGVRYTSGDVGTGRAHPAT